ncbi:MAG TPA: MBL fold metallo-hydrolase, partial [Novosphingobium sp.]|nr:MBL fold metallo-hydrolase [Novosphingobium sp.]
QLAMSPLEYYMLRALVPELGHGEPPELRAFYRAAGWSEAELDEVLAGLGAFGQIVAPLPSQFAALREGQRLTIGARSWEVLMGQGHSPQHALLHCAADGLLISGDQVLPDISSNVSVYPQEPAADPLSDWLASLAAIRRRVPDDTLVLPAHGRPFRGLHARIDALIDGHERGLARLHARLTEPQRAVDVFGALFRQKIGPRTLQMATGECLAHLACLGTRGLATCAPNAAGIGWWQAAPAPAPHADNA